MLWPFAVEAATQYVEGDVIVTFKASANIDTARATLNRKSMAFTHRFGWLSARRGKQMGLIRHKSKTTAEMIADLKDDPTVESVEPNYLRWVNAQPNDSRFSDMWALKNTGQTVDSITGTSGADVKFIDAWNQGRITNDQVVVGVIDTGVDTFHPDLHDNVWVNPQENNNNADDDSDGYIDDVSGFDFVADKPDPSDSGYHGTHVAGTIAAIGNNAAGTIGMSYRAKVMSLKVSSDGDTISTSAVIEALQYATMMKNRGVNIVALNASYGGGGFSAAERDAIQAAGNAGIILCAAAGNDGTNNDVTQTYPASYRLSNMIVVAATDQNDALASFSNYGASSVDIAAPGTNILSLEPSSIAVKVGNTSYTAFAMTFSGMPANQNGRIYDCGLGNPGDFPSAVSGNIALIQRGTLTFESKVANAMAAGAIGAIVYNNVSGSFGGTLNTPGAWIPAVTISLSDGAAIKSSLPNSATFTISGNYQYLDGTSMATPHVTGAVAFAAMNFPNETVAQRIHRILTSVDTKTKLSGKVATGGRLNLLRTVDANSNGVPDWLETSNPAAPTITTTTPLPGGLTNNAYSVTLTATGGQQPYVYSLISGTLPDGLSLSSTGVLTGTPTVAGAWTFAVQVKDNVQVASGKQMTINVASTPLEIATTSPLSGGAVAVAYSATLTATGGSQPYTWSVASGSLPPGLTLSSAGVISGTPSNQGTYNFTARVTDVSLTTFDQPLSVVIQPLPLSIPTASSLAVGALTADYSQTLAVKGGTGPFVWTLNTGALPGGLTLSEAGVISGIPTEVGVFNFEVKVTDSASRTLTKSFSITVQGTPLIIATESPLTPGVKAVAYTQTFTGTGGAPPYTWTTSAGALPAGLTLTTTGVLSGKPTLAASYGFTLKATDSLGYFTTKTYSLAITATYVKPVVNDIDLGTTTIGVPYTRTVSANNYAKSYNITHLPSGLTYSATTGVISGRALVSGTFQVQIKASNPAGYGDVLIRPLVVTALPPEFIGTFTGLIDRDPTANANLGGRLTLTTTLTGSYTAKVTTGATTKSIVGYLSDTVPQIQATVGTSLLSLTFDTGSQTVSGTHGAANVNGWRSTWTAAHPATSRMGYYTIGLDLADAGDLGVATIPQGSGYASFTVANTGALTVAGKAADGTAFTSAGFIGPDGEIPIYSSLYANLGSLAGTLDLAAKPAIEDNTVSGVLTWLKPVTKTPRSYPAAFGPINLNTYGKYLAVASTRGILDGLPATGLINILFTGGGVSASQTDPDVTGFTFTATKTVDLKTAGTSGNPAKATLTINKNTGLIGGTFTLVETSPALTRRVTFQGMIVRPLSGNAKAEGYFLLPQIPTVGQTISTSPILSGRVVIDQSTPSQ